MGFNMFFDKKKPEGSKRPDYQGNGSIDADVLDYIIGCVQRGDDKVELEVVGWKKQGQAGPYQSLAINIPWKIRKDAEESGEPLPSASRSSAKPAGGGKKPKQKSFDDDDIPFAACVQ